MGHRRVITLAMALVLLAGAAAVPVLSAEMQSESTELQLSQPTRQFLREQSLKRLARQEPRTAIQSLDALRTTVENPAELSIAIAEVALRAAAQTPTASSLGLYLCAASETQSLALEQALDAAAMTPQQSPSALNLHRTAVEGLIEALQELDSEVLSGRAAELDSPLHRYRLSWVNAADTWTPATHQFRAASGIRQKKARLSLQASGVGSPVVAVRKDDRPDEELFEGRLFPIYKYYYPLTAVLELDDGPEEAPRAATVRFLDPRVHQSVALAGEEYPLAADIGAQFAVVERETDVIHSMGGVRHAGKFLTVTGLYVAEPLRSDRIPVVLIHGLKSSPVTWTRAFEQFQLDTELRQRYQFWFFAYPTGLPFPYSASLLRGALFEVMERLDPAGDNPLLRQTVLVGHSMGGLITRMLVTDSGNVLWNAVYTKPPEEMGLDDDDVAQMKEVLIVEPLPFATTAIFCATPHRGSNIAANEIGKLGASLVSLPGEARDLGDRVVLGASDFLTPEAAKRRKLPDSVQTLRSDATIIKALDTLEVDPSITYYSIVGDRGKGNAPDSRDGVVPYWSSHLEGAAHEEIVPSNHSVHQHPDGIAELIRILYLHLEEVD